MTTWFRRVSIQAHPSFHPFAAIRSTIASFVRIREGRKCGHGVSAHADDQNPLRSRGTPYSSVSTRWICIVKRPNGSPPVDHSMAVLAVSTSAPRPARAVATACPAKSAFERPEHPREIVMLSQYPGRGLAGNLSATQLDGFADCRLGLAGCRWYRRQAFKRHQGLVLI
jgi:hypothetical protein